MKKELDYELSLFEPISYEDFIEYHQHELFETISYARKSPLYRKKISKINDIENLSKLPLTFYEDINSSINAYGLENVLLESPVKCFQTSGYSGAPKKFYYAKKDLENTIKIGSDLAYIFGLRAGDVVWNLCAPEPYGSAYLQSEVLKRIGAEEIITYIEKPQDMINSLKVLSKLDKIDGMCGIPIVLLTIGQIIQNPGRFKEKVKETIKNKLGKFGIFASLIESLYFRNINFEKLQQLCENINKAFYFGELLKPYYATLKKIYPKIVPKELYGSTELMIGAVQFSEKEGLSIPLEWYIPEIVDPYEIEKAKHNSESVVEGIPWWKWYKGLKGELVVTKKWNCLPLIRYPTGDLIEVLETKRTEIIKLDFLNLKVTYPVIKILGRSHELFDFQTPEEGVRYAGVNIFSRQIKDALANVKTYGGIKWWELHVFKNIHFLNEKNEKIGPFTKLRLKIIPEDPVKNLSSFEQEVYNSVVKECNELQFVLNKLNEAYPKVVEKLIEIEVLEPKEYRKIEEEIEKRVKEGRPLGQIKPKQIHVHDSVQS